MRSSRTRSDERRQKLIRTWVSIGIIFLLVSSTAAFYFGSTGTSTRYNGFTVTANTNQGTSYPYLVKIKGDQVPFFSAPADSESIVLPVGFIDSLKQSQGFIFLFNPDDNQTNYYDAVRFDFSTIIKDKPQGAAVTQTSPDSSYAFQVLSCSSATSEYPIVLLRPGPREVLYENGCFVVQGNAQDILLLRDRIIYAYYGVSTY
jgi:hypothetical protein